LGKTALCRQADRQGIMGRILKYFFYLILLGAFGIVLYAYVGPHLGEDFSRPMQEIREKVTLDAK
jgi:hypothetical protein